MANNIDTLLNLFKLSIKRLNLKRVQKKWGKNTHFLSNAIKLKPLNRTPSILRKHVCVLQCVSV